MLTGMSVGVSFLITALVLISSSSESHATFVTITRETEKRKEQTNGSSGGCILPQQPLHGVYTSPQCQLGEQASGCRNSPGTVVPNTWLLTYSCNDNYSLTSQLEYSICANGTWKNPLDCIKLCEPLVAVTMDITCEYNSQEVPCTMRMMPNTTVTANCKQHYMEVNNREYSKLHCLDNGEWNYPLFYCAPACGLSTGASLVPLIKNGSPSRQGEFPWAAGIYFKADNGSWELRCMGTLISTHLVLTAAHCVVSNVNNIALQADSLKVGLGKYYRDYYRQEAASVISDVREVVVHHFYLGRSTSFANDIAILDLTSSVTVTANVMPACVDLSSSSISIVTDTVGQVASWGQTENGTLSDVLLSAKLKTIEHLDCLERLRVNSKRYLSYDKICAEGVNGSQIAKLDSGVGLTYLIDGKHFVVGLASTKLTQMSLLTDLTNIGHRSWLEETINHLKRLHLEFMKIITF